MAAAAGKLGYGERAAREVSGRILGSFADEATLKALPTAKREHGALAVTIDGAKIWVLNAESTASASATVLVPDEGSGRWVHAEAAPQA